MPIYFRRLPTSGIAGRILIRRGGAQSTLTAFLFHGSTNFFRPAFNCLPSSPCPTLLSPPPRGAETAAVRAPRPGLESCPCPRGPREGAKVFALHAARRARLCGLARLPLVLISLILNFSVPPSLVSLCPPPRLPLVVVVLGAPKNDPDFSWGPF